MLKKSLYLLFSVIITISSATGQSRKVIHIPDIPGYRTLKCDFHTHTVFSDGLVWPTVRVEEAWQEGLDAVSITDHIEYRPHSKDINADFNRSCEIAEPIAANRNIILIKGAEITRSTPPGHLNTLFIRNANLLNRENVFDAIKEAHDQGAFIIWNHPGRDEQQPESSFWKEEHTRLLQNNMLHGIEIYNHKEFYPEAFDRAIEKKLTVFAGTNTHEPTSMVYDIINSHRPITLVFAKSRTEGGIREALFSRRTAVWFDNTIAGQAEFLKLLFFSSLKISKPAGNFRLGETKRVEIENISDIDYELELVQPATGFNVSAQLTLKSHHITVLKISSNSEQLPATEELRIYYKVKNMLVGSDENLVITFSVNIN